MYIDHIELAKDALNHMGRQDCLVDELDPHAPVELHFDAAPTIAFMPTEEGSIQLRARLSEQMGIPFNCNATRIIEAIAAPADWSSHRCLSLLDIDGHIYLVASVHVSFLRDGAVFSEALVEFYNRLVAIHKSFNG